MRLAALVDSPNHVCCRYRLRAFEPFLKQNGHTLTYLSDTRRWRDRWKTARQLGEFDAVILQRRLPNWWESVLIRRYAKHLIFDMDDAVWLRDSFAKKGFESRKLRGRFGTLMKRVDVATVGNDYLGNASLQSGATQVRVIPTCVDVERYPVAEHSGTQPSIVWIGSSSTLQGIEQYRELWERVGTEFPQLSLRVICDRFPKFDRLNVIPIPWAEATEREQIAASDIGISWIPNDIWSRGKCGLKLLQFMAAGLPVIANRVGVHPEMIQHGKNGYLADTPEEWLTAIQSLVQNPTRRREMGALGREIVRQRYSVEAGAAQWLELLGQS